MESGGLVDLCFDVVWAASVLLREQRWPRRQLLCYLVQLLVSQLDPHIRELLYRLLHLLLEVYLGLTFLRLVYVHWMLEELGTFGQPGLCRSP